MACFAFLLVATAQVSNMILARALPVGTAVSIAFFRWTIVAVGLLPMIVAAFAPIRSPSQGRWGISAAGFLGMFICGGPVYIAGITTSAINVALIMAMAPLVVLLFSWASGSESINRVRSRAWRSPWPAPS